MILIAALDDFMNQTIEVSGYWSFGDEVHNEGMFIGNIWKLIYRSRCRILNDIRKELGYWT